MGQLQHLDKVSDKLTFQHCRWLFLEDQVVVFCDGIRGLSQGQASALTKLLIWMVQRKHKWIIGNFIAQESVRYRLAIGLLDKKNTQGGGEKILSEGKSLFAPPVRERFVLLPNPSIEKASGRRCRMFCVRWASSSAGAAQSCCSGELRGQCTLAPALGHGSFLQQEKIVQMLLFLFDGDDDDDYF